MAYDLAMNMTTGDLIIESGDVILVDNAERVAQQILITLRHWLGEWFLDTSQGVPYLEYVLVKNPNLLHIRQIFAEAIGGVDGVERVDNIKLDFDRVNRQLIVDYTVTTQYGVVERRERLGYRD